MFDVNKVVLVNVHPEYETVDGKRLLECAGRRILAEAGSKGMPSGTLNGRLVPRFGAPIWWVLAIDWGVRSHVFFVTDDKADLANMAQGPLCDADAAAIVCAITPPPRRD